MIKQMSTDARKVIGALTSLVGSDMATVHNVLVAESLCYSFYAKTIVAHVNRFYNPESKSDETDMGFYNKPIRSINKGRRNKENWLAEEIPEDKYQVISNYVDVDWNYDTLKQLKEAFELYELSEFKSAIQIASTEAQVYSVPFLLRVLESERAEKVRIAERRRRQREAQEDSRTGINNQVVVKRSPIEVASLAMGWAETINTMDLENLLKETGIIEHSDDI